MAGDGRQDYLPLLLSYTTLGPSAFEALAP